MKQHSRLWAMLALFSLLALGGQSQSQSTQIVLSNAEKSFSQGRAVHSVTLTATAHWIAGSDNETGHATLTANADGSFTAQLQLSQSARKEAQTSFSSGKTCTWAGTDGVVHATAAQNCMGTLSWFLPQVQLFGGQQPSAVSITIMSGPNQSFIDLRQQRTTESALNPQLTTLMAHLGTTDLYLDPVTYLPAILSYNLHPDKNAAADIPVQITFTDYQAVNGVSIPFRIQRYINGVLNLDLTVTEAFVN
jgi:hypothetical protein